MPIIDAILVNSLYSKNSKVLKDKYVKFDYDENSSKSLVKDERVAPKQNYSKIDAQFVNLNAHKGPDEL